MYSEGARTWKVSTAKASFLAMLAMLHIKIEANVFAC